MFSYLQYLFTGIQNTMACAGAMQFRRIILRFQAKMTRFCLNVILNVVEQLEPGLFRWPKTLMTLVGESCHRTIFVFSKHRIGFKVCHMVTLAMKCVG